MIKHIISKSEGDKKKDFIYVNSIIHGFAIVHAAACFSLLSAGLSDGLILTVLTIIMIVLLINYFNGTTDVFLSLSVLSCLAGFYLGTAGAKLIDEVIGNNVLTHVIATVLVTEILGWLVFLILRKRMSIKK